ncbi:hypothetical protein BDQ12DRAFT_222029 [Crucibulum laeve]|uniref:Uncharacterized protein n=1 Tax=Crucibulum laeve TaxID=68775 RepID=A0A5C3LVT0_9AGAR|nr:hypothetical protein BDQ12DRAFT_222029 [Crucibulum laeve]
MPYAACLVLEESPSTNHEETHLINAFHDAHKPSVYHMLRSIWRPRVNRCSLHVRHGGHGNVSVAWCRRGNQCPVHDDGIAYRFMMALRAQLVQQPYSMRHSCCASTMSIVVQIGIHVVVLQQRLLLTGILQDFNTVGHHDGEFSIQRSKASYVSNNIVGCKDGNTKDLASLRLQTAKSGGLHKHGLT